VSTDEYEDESSIHDIHLKGSEWLEKGELKDDDDDNKKPIWPTWAVGALFRGARSIHIKRKEAWRLFQKTARKTSLFKQPRFTGSVLNAGGLKKVQESQEFVRAGLPTVETLRQLTCNERAITNKYQTMNL
jgi:hypothetical protein